MEGQAENGYDLLCATGMDGLSLWPLMVLCPARRRQASAVRSKMPLV